MNKILQNLINTREVVSFIDNVIVDIKKGERYDEIVEKVVRRLAENYFICKAGKMQVEC